MRTKRITNLADASVAAALADFLTDGGHLAVWLNSIRSRGLEVVTDAPRGDIEQACMALGVAL